MVGYTLSPLISRKVRSGLSAGRVQSVAVRLVVDREREIRAFTRDRVLDDRGAPHRPGWRRLQRRARPGRRREAVDRGRRDRGAPRGGAPGESTGGRVDRGQALEADPGAAVHHVDPPAGGEPQARLQPEADDVGRPAAVRGRRDPGGPGRPDHLHADGLGGDVRPGPRRGARGDRRPLRPRLHHAKGPSVQDEDSQRPGGPRGDPADLLPARPGQAGPRPRARRGPPLSAHLAAGAGQPDEGEGARDDDGRPVGRDVPAAGERDEDGLRRLQPGLHRGPGRRVRGGRASPPGPGRGRCHQGGRRHLHPALHRAAAALHRGDPDQGARGERDRPAVDVRRDDLDDRRPRLRQGRRAASPPGADRRGGDRPAGRSLRRVRRPGLHRPDGGRARRDRPRRAAVGPAPARVLRAAQGAGRREAGAPPPARLHDRAVRRGLLARPSDGRPARPERPVPGLLALPGAQGVAPAARRGRGGAGPARGRRAVPEVRGDRGRGARRPARPVRPVRRLRPVPGLRLHQAGRAAAARAPPVRGRLPALRRGPAHAPPGAPDGLAVLGLLALPEVRLHDLPRAARGDPRRRRRSGRPEGRGRRDVPPVRLARWSCRPPRSFPGRACPVGRPIRPPWPGPPVAAGEVHGVAAPRGRALAAAGSGRRGRPPGDGRAAGAAGPRARQGRDRRRRPRAVPRRADGPRRIRPHATLVRDRRRRLPRLARRARARLAAARAGTTCGPTSRSCRSVMPGPRSASGSPRSGRSTGTPPGTTCAPATRGARSRRRASRSACPRSSRRARSRSSWRSSTSRLPRRPPGRPGRPG